MPADPQVRTKCDYHYPVAPLGDAVVCGIHRVHLDIVFKIVFWGSILQIRKMVSPSLGGRASETGRSECEKQVVKIVLKCRPQEPFDIFDENGLGTKFPRRANNFAKHVSSVAVSHPLPAERKRLARKARCEQIYIRGEN